MDLFDVSRHVSILYFEMFQSHPEIKIEHKQAVGFEYTVFVAARFTEIFLTDKPSIALAITNSGCFFVDSKDTTKATDLSGDKTTSTCGFFLNLDDCLVCES